MGKIGDLWVRLGLKKDGYTKGMDEAKKENQGFGASLGKMKAGALAVWAAIGTAVVGFAKQMIEGTNRIGDAWNHTTAQMKAGWDVFIQSVSNWNWDNFIGRIRESAAAAKELQGALDFEFEATNSINLQKSMMSEELAQLQIDMRDVNKSYEERAAAAQKYLDKVEPIYQQEIELRKSLMDAYSKKWLSNSGIEYNEKSLQDLQKFLVAYGSNSELIDAAGSFLEGKPGSIALTTGVALSRDPKAKRKELNERISEYNAAVAKLDELEKSLGISNLKALITTYEKYRGDKDTEPLIKAIQDYYNAQAAYNAENRRVFSSLNTALAGMDSETVTTLGEAATQVERMTDSISALGDIQGLAQVQETPDLIPDDWLTRNREKIDQVIAEKERLLAAGQMLNDALTAGTTNALDELANAIAGVEGADAGSVVKALLTPLADAAIKAGMLILAQGVAVEAFKESLTSLNGPAAIAAGAALIAVGVAAKAGLAAIGSGSTAGTGSSSYSGGYDSTYTPALEPQELTIHVDGRISGSDIVLAADRTRNKQNR